MLSRAASRVARSSMGAPMTLRTFATAGTQFQTNWGPDGKIVPHGEKFIRILVQSDLWCNRIFLFLDLMKN
jgi:hypothetical protein